jgi:hypothetical protein
MFDMAPFASFRVTGYGGGGAPYTRRSSQRTS